MEELILYHGTDLGSAKQILRGIDLYCGDKSVDNGTGFYLTDSKAFAEDRAVFTANRNKFFGFDGNKTKAAIVKFNVVINNDDLAIKVFNSCNYYWKEFIILNRLGMQKIKELNIESNNHNLDSKYDIVADETADNRINRKLQSIVSELMIGEKIEKIIKETDISPGKNFGRQISFHTKKALNCIKQTSIIEL